MNTFIIPFPEYITFNLKFNSFLHFHQSVSSSLKTFQFNCLHKMATRNISLSLDGCDVSIFFYINKLFQVMVRG